MERIQNYLGGEFKDSMTGDFMEVYEPAVGLVYGSMPRSTQDDVHFAVDQAVKASDSWAALAPDARSKWLIRIAEAIEHNADQLAKAESKDTGKPITLAKQLDIPRAAANFRFFATSILHSHTPAHHTNAGIFNYTNRHPVGVAGCISPWNLPLYLLTWKIAPALATGNCVVAKPSEITPMTAYLLSGICERINFPKGVINIIHGPGPTTGEAIVTHPDVSAISFTGGTQTGRRIASLAAPSFKKVSLEMGGKNPNIIFDDCNLEAAIDITIKSSFTNQGQICLCGSRVFVQKGIYKKFRTALVESARNLQPSDPSDPNTKMGALSSKPHLKKVLGYIELAKSEGGKILTGGNRVHLKERCKDGYFMQPTIVEGLDNRCRTNQEEIFGPVISLIPFSEEEEVVAMANDSGYGLSATIWTENLSRAHRVSKSLKCGVVWVNCWLVRDLRTPFGGMKQSGVGREGGEEALRFFTEAQNVCLKI
ncbi:MAG: aldehyde dehydrogenase [Cyclobacteriaceae bacterium]|nr:MAG: aldehyde dehydrogenase [Cyclobacteriaceae bacterium]